MKTAEEILAEYSGWDIVTIKQPSMQTARLFSPSSVLKAMDAFASQKQPEVTEEPQYQVGEKPVIEQIVLNVLEGMNGIGGIPGNEDFCDEFDMRLRGAMDVKQPSKPEVTEEEIVDILVEHIAPTEGEMEFINTEGFFLYNRRILEISQSIMKLFKPE